jgi:hypothetical protein
MNWKGFGSKRSWPYLKVLSRNSLGGTEKNHNPRDSRSPGPRFEPWISRMLNRSVNHSTTKFSDRHYTSVPICSVAPSGVAGAMSYCMLACRDQPLCVTEMIMLSNLSLFNIPQLSDITGKSVSVKEGSTSEIYKHAGWNVPPDCLPVTSHQSPDPNKVVFLVCWGIL